MFDLREASKELNSDCHRHSYARWEILLASPQSQAISYRMKWQKYVVLNHDCLNKNYLRILTCILFRRRQCWTFFSWSNHVPEEHLSVVSLDKKFCLFVLTEGSIIFVSFFSVRVVKSEQISCRVRSIATKSTCLLTTAAFVVPCILFCFNFNKWWKVFRLLIAWASLPSMECGAEVGGRKTFFYIYFQYLKDPWRALHVCFTFVKTFS